VQAIVALRKRELRARGEKGEEKTAPPPRPGSRLVDRFEAEVRRHPSALGQLEELARRLGYTLVPIAGNTRPGA
jgi:hypothetical protein